MDDKQRIAVRESIKELRKALNDGTLQGEARVDAERTISMASGKLLSFWLPVGWVRKVIMLMMFLVGCYGLFIGQPLYLICWALAIAFSPRIVGTVAMFLGEISGKK